MHTTIINDCRDANAAGRQCARAASLIGGTVSFVGVASDLEAAGNLIDVLDAYGESAGVVLVNVAPRNGTAKKWQNGTPFGYFWYKKVLVVSSIDGLTLSLVKKLGLVEHINVLDIPAVTAHFVSEGVLSEEARTHICETQFRSFDFLPRVAAYLVAHTAVVAEPMALADVADAPNAIWWVDNFGNCKTTLFRDALPAGGTVATRIGDVRYYEHLREVPDGAPALVTGSSGLGEKRFVEVVVQGGSAAQTHGLSSGDAIV